MTKKDIVGLAEVLRIHNQRADARTEFTPDHLRVLADFCAAQYPTFNRERWIDYIAGLNRGESTPQQGKIGPRFTASKKPEQKTLQSLLRQLRVDAGLRQKDIARALGKRPAFVSYYETGARRLDLLELREVCEVLGISLAAFVRKFEKKLLDPTLPALSTQGYPPRRLPADASHKYLHGHTLSIGGNGLIGLTQYSGMRYFEMRFAVARRAGPASTRRHSCSAPRRDKAFGALPITSSEYHLAWIRQGGKQSQALNPSPVEESPACWFG